jgi:hypothetical protein
MAMRSLMGLGFLGMTVLVSACSAFAGDEQAVAKPESLSLDPSGKGNSNASGTWLSTTGSAGAIACTGEGTALVSFSGLLTSTAAKAPADVYLTVDGNTSLLDEIAPQDFSGKGPTKTHSWAYSIPLTDGGHDVQICFEQPAGNERMTACTDVFTVVVACSSDGNSCQETPFGETIGNQNMCKGAGNPSVNINAKGDFGDAATVKIEAVDVPLGFSSITRDIAHSGESCVYHYRWTPKDDGASAGTYRFTVDGNGKSATWTANLFCYVPPSL